VTRDLIRIALHEPYRLILIINALELNASELSTPKRLGVLLDYQQACQAHALDVCIEAMLVILERVSRISLDLKVQVLALECLSEALHVSLSVERHYIDFIRQVRVLRILMEVMLRVVVDFVVADDSMEWFGRTDLWAEGRTFRGHRVSSRGEERFEVDVCLMGLPESGEFATDKNFFFEEVVYEDFLVEEHVACLVPDAGSVLDVSVLLWCGFGMRIHSLCLSRNHIIEIHQQGVGLGIVDVAVLGGGAVCECDTERLKERFVTVDTIATLTSLTEFYILVAKSAICAILNMTSVFVREPGSIVEILNPAIDVSFS
jgi:hypothetical protein